MRPKKHETTGSGDLFRARLDQIINLKHELVQLAGKIDWAWIDGEIAPLYSDKGRPGIETRFVIGLLLLKHIYGLSDEGVCERWVYDPYFQYFTGEEFFQHAFPHERSDLSHWRKRLGDKLELLLAESLRVAHQTGALRTKDLARVTVDTTVQPKNVTFPTDAKLLHAAIKGLNRLAKKHGRAAAAILSARRQTRGDDGGALCPRQAVQPPSSPIALPAHAARPADPRHPPQDRRGRGDLEAAFAAPLSRAAQIRSQRQRQRGWKLYSFHAPRSSASARARPARLTSSASRSRSSPPMPARRAASSCCTPRRCRAIPTTDTRCGPSSRTRKSLTGREIERAYVDKGYRGHDAPNPRRVFISGQKRGVFGAIKRELRRRSAIEPVIGHMKAEGHLGRCYLKGRAGDAANAILTAVGYNLRRVLAWLRALCA